MRITANILWTATVASLLVVCPAVAARTDIPNTYLEFESVGDGRCQILSKGGKLRVLHNRHPKLTIDFRLTRIFAGKPQGLSTGIAEPNAPPVKLGCTRVDGREQDWVLERVRFVQGTP
jgi:hypothetical protein